MVEEASAQRLDALEVHQGASFPASATAEGRQFNDALSCLQGRCETTAVAATA
jgi:hypothetical protein